jgi:hypothetical protein
MRFLAGTGYDIPREFHCEAALDFHDEVYGDSGESLPGGA